MEDMSMGWVGCILSTLFVGAVAYYSRRFVREHAPFYAASNILIVGATFGIVFGVLAHFLGNYGMPLEGRTLLITFSFIGFALTIYIGHRPDPIDWAKKSKQTAMVGTVCYSIVAIAMFFLDPPT
jgi:hypothetical protein